MFCVEKGNRSRSRDLKLWHSNAARDGSRLTRIHSRRACADADESRRRRSYSLSSMYHMLLKNLVSAGQHRGHHECPCCLLFCLRVQPPAAVARTVKRTSALDALQRLGSRAAATTNAAAPHPDECRRTGQNATQH